MRGHNCVCMHIFQTYRQGKIRFVCFDDMCTHSERERERERERVYRVTIKGWYCEDDQKL